MIKEQLPGEIRELMGLNNYDPYDQFVQYRLRTLAVRAAVLGDTEGMREIERISNGVLRHSSPTGTAIADYAENRALGSGRYCYEYVARALASAGINVYGGSAFMASNQLAIHPMVREIKGLRAGQLSGLPQGTIVVWNRSDYHIHGHISISLGNGEEVSDKVRDQITKYGTSFRVFVPLDMMNDPVNASAVNSDTADAHAPLLQVIRAGDSVTADEMIERGIIVNIKDSRFRWQLLDAAEPGIW
ncbi:MAG: hypothetical protein RDV48_20050 [Candidatus Eremiobacteraeota bacterium]|nr:hypothetical protein [Candidatus Eremiobacteraeota bacterium]